MSTKMRHVLLISMTMIALLFASVIISYAETTNYIYDELNRLIQVTYEDGGGVAYTYDASGNRITLTQNVDTVPPTGTIIINSGAAVTNSPAVTLTLSCTDNVGCSQMKFSNDVDNESNYSTPEAYGTTKSWTLSPGDGTKIVYAKFRDQAGNWSTAYSGTINLDSYTKSLLHMNGTNGSTTFTDSAIGGTHTWTAHGNAKIDTAQSKFGGASGLFDGAGSWIDTPDSSDFASGSGDFTIDFWVKRGSINSRQPICGQASSGGSYIWGWVEFQANNTVRGICNKSDNSTYYAATSVGTIADTTTWHHIAFLRYGNQLRLYIDGSLGGTKDVTGITLIDSSYKFAIGRGGEWTSYYFNGRIDEFRLSKGIARWTANFTPPTGQYSP